MNFNFVISRVFVSFFGIMVFLFLAWRRLKEDYSSGVVFSLCFFVLSGLLLGYLIGIYFFDFWWFWFVVFGIILGLVAALLKFKLRPYESIEAVLISLLPYLSFIFLLDSIESSSIVSFVGFFVTILFLGLFTYLDANFRSFSWYKSGRVGFSGLTTLGLLFLVRAVVACFFPFVISFVGRFEALISGIIAFAFFITVFNLSRSAK